LLLGPLHQAEARTRSQGCGCRGRSSGSFFLTSLSKADSFILRSGRGCASSSGIEPVSLSCSPDGCRRRLPSGVRNSALLLGPLHQAEARTRSQGCGCRGRSSGSFFLTSLGKADSFILRWLRIDEAIRPGVQGGQERFPARAKALRLPGNYRQGTSRGKPSWPGAMRCSRNLAELRRRNSLRSHRDCRGSDHGRRQSRQCAKGRQARVKALSEMERNLPIQEASGPFVRIFPQASSLAPSLLRAADSEAAGA